MSLHNTIHKTQKNRSRWQKRFRQLSPFLALVFLLLGLLASNGSTHSEGVNLNFQPPKSGIIAQNNAPEVPDHEDLAGEVVPMEAFGVRDQFDRELIVNTYRHSSTLLYFKRAARWFPVIEPILAESGLPDDFKYLAIIESGLSQVVSPAGAAGFWQFMKSTAPAYGLTVNNQMDERYHVEKSTRAACQYLLESKEEFGSWALAAASYNMGRAGVQRALQTQGVESYWDLHLNDETARYVFRMLAIKTIFENPEAFGFYIQPEALYSEYASRTIWPDATISDLSAFALKEGTNLKALKTLNPWLRSSRLNVNVGDSVALKLPLP
jgi:hypothetical protein